MKYLVFEGGNKMMLFGLQQIIYSCTCNSVRSALMVYDQFFFGGGRGGGWRGGSSEGCLKWGGGGVIKESFQKHLKTGWVKAKVVHRGEGG